MRLKPLGSNQTEIVSNDTSILFSYRTPVAYHVTGKGFFRTTKFWSKTTSRHINKWIEGSEAKKVNQADIDSLAFSFNQEKGGL